MVVLGRRKKRVLFFLYSQIIHLATRFLGIGMIATLHYTNGMVVYSKGDATENIRGW